MPTLTIADPSLVVLVGPAGSGKSTLARRHFGADEILSSDALRAVVAGDEADQSASRAAFSILQRELARRLSGGLLTVVDATNLRREHRRPLLERARTAGVPAGAIVLDLAPDLIRAQNAGRARVVDPEVIDRHLAWLRRTVDDGQLTVEGFEPIVVLRTAAEVDDLRVVRVPLSPPS